MGEKKNNNNNGHVQKKGNNNGQGEKKIKDNKKEDNKQGGGEKKGDGNNKKANSIVLGIEMHCQGCAKKIVRIIKRIQGVEDVKADWLTNKVTITGKVDPVKLRENAVSKIKKKVELISPSTKKEKGSTEAVGTKPAEKTDKKKEPQVTTVTLKTKLHCEGCTQKMHKTISKIKGVETVKIDKMQDLVTVKGSIDVNELLSYLKKKYNKNVEIIQPKKDGGGGGADKKDKTTGQKKGKGGGGGRGDEKEKNETKVEEESIKTGFVDYYAPTPGYGYNVYAPQLFSDENPNACCVM